jgi:hypothetical protein
MEWTRQDIEEIAANVARRVASVVVTERFEGIGINDSDIDHRQITTKNNFFLNALRQKHEEALLKSSLREIIVNVAGQAIWVIVSGLTAWGALQLYHHITP